MDRIHALVTIILALSITYANAGANSVTIYPFNIEKTRQLIPYTNPQKSELVRRGVHNWDIRNGHYIQSADAFSLNNKISQADAAAISKAITGQAPVKQSAAKRILLSALPTLGAGLLMTFAAQYGMEYISGQLVKKETHTSGYRYNDHIYPSIQDPFASNFCNEQHKPLCPSGWRTSHMGPYPIHGTTDVSIGCKCCHWGGCTSKYDKSYILKGPGSSTTRPATQQDIDQFSTNTPPLTDPALKELAERGHPIPIEKEEVTVIDSHGLSPSELQWLMDRGYYWPTPDSIAVPISDTYKDPLTSETKRDYVTLSEAPNAGVRIEPHTQKTHENGKPLEVPGEPGKVQPGQESKLDPCEINPDRAGCAKLGTLNEVPPAPTVQSVAITPQAAWGGSGQCPADVVFNVMGHTIPFKFTGACQFFAAMNPVVQAAAWAAAIYLLVTGARREA